MISNIKYCCIPCCSCSQCSNPNKKFYLEIKNESSEYLNAILIYTIFGKDVTKPTIPFGQGKIERIVFPDGAKCVFFQVFRTSFKPPALICTRCIADNMISRFKVQEIQPGKLICVKF